MGKLDRLLVVVWLWLCLWEIVAQDVDDDEAFLMPIQDIRPVTETKTTDNCNNEECFNYVALVSSGMEDDGTNPFTLISRRTQLLKEPATIIIQEDEKMCHASFNVFDSATTKKLFWGLYMTKYDGYQIHVGFKQHPNNTMCESEEERPLKIVLFAEGECSAENFIESKFIIADVIHAKPNTRVTAQVPHYSYDGPDYIEEIPQHDTSLMIYLSFKDH